MKDYQVDELCDHLKAMQSSRSIHAIFKETNIVNTEDFQASFEEFLKLSGQAYDEYDTRLPGFVDEFKFTRLLAERLADPFCGDEAKIMASADKVAGFFNATKISYDLYGKSAMAILPKDYNYSLEGNSFYDDIKSNAKDKRLAPKVDRKMNPEINYEC